MKIIILSIFLLFFIPHSAKSGDVTIANLLEYCTTMDSINQTACYAFFNGHLQGITTSEVFSGNMEESFYCLDEGVTMEQLVALFLKMAKQIPEHHHRSAGGAIGRMLLEYFPCD